MAWFTGTSTGKTYEVGKQYVSAGDVYTANANGTFTNERSGRTNVGSSQSPTALFGGYQSLSSPLPGLWSNDPDWRGSGGSGPGNAGASSAPGYAGRGPGVSGSAGDVVSSGPGSPVVRKASAGSFLTIAGGNLAMGSKLNKTTRLAWSGDELNLDRTTSDGGEGEQRWGEWGGALYGLGVMFNDGLHGVGVNTEKLWTDVGTNGNPTKWAPDLADAAIDFAGYLGERKAEINEKKRRQEVGQDFMWADPLRMYKQWGMYPDGY